MLLQVYSRLSGDPPLLCARAVFVKYPARMRRSRTRTTAYHPTDQPPTASPSTVDDARRPFPPPLDLALGSAGAGKYSRIATRDRPAAGTDTGTHSERLAPFASTVVLTS